MKIGYFLSSEEWGPAALVELAGRAQRAGFEGLSIDQDAFFDAYQDHVLPRFR